LDAKVKIDGDYDQRADIASLRFAGYDPDSGIGEQTAVGLRELDPVGGRLVGLEFWRASQQLPDELPAMLQAPPLNVAG
jgi:hypothetical protein